MHVACPESSQSSEQRLTMTGGKTVSRDAAQWNALLIRTFGRADAEKEKEEERDIEGKMRQVVLQRVKRRNPSQSAGLEWSATALRGGN